MSRYAYTRVPASQPVGIAHGANGYTCPELRPNSTRPGSMVAHALASRMNNSLHWPGGRVTDLHGATTQDSE